MRRLLGVALLVILRPPSPRLPAPGAAMPVNAGPGPASASPATQPSGPSPPAPTPSTRPSSSSSASAPFMRELDERMYRLAQTSGTWSPTIPPASSWPCRSRGRSSSSSRCTTCWTCSPARTWATPRRSRPGHRQARGAAQAAPGRRHGPPGQSSCASSCWTRRSPASRRL